MQAAEIRAKFLDYFQERGHTIEHSASLVPHNDKTLLFVNAGMVPFKDVFSGAEKRPYKRAVSCQRCVRAGGKHNDLENVGYTARHHTFFEMLGNFSFGDYFKREAIKFAWDFLTVELAIPKEKLWVSVFKDDLEAEEIWVNEIGFPRERISRCGADNFWQMGDTGPCGPSSEIFYDHGEHIFGGPPGDKDEDGDRYIEIWNLVFTQYDRQADGYLKPLAKPCVDTGMGLERIAAVLQHTNNNYEIDSFKKLINAIISFIPATQNNDYEQASVRVIADHIRAVSFMIADGVIPANEGRGYVLRRIIRRAIRHGRKIGITQYFLYLLVKTLAAQNNKAYPELNANLSMVERTLEIEEQRFSQTLDQGMLILTDAIANLKNKQISGDTAFKLYDTYGFPIDLTADIARERGLTIDIDGFNLAMDAQKQRARMASDFKGAQQGVVIDYHTEFVGYDNLTNSAIVKALIKDCKAVDAINAGDAAVVVLSSSSCYAESGGQVGDSAVLKNDNMIFVVDDTKKQVSCAFEHYGKLTKGQIKVGDKLEVVVDKNRRIKIAANHSATHLLHAALRKVIGNEVMQKGSLVDSTKLRFDFSCNQALTTKQVDSIEALVNSQIINNTKVNTDITDIESAKNKGAMSLFGEKYDKVVRVLSMGDDNFSIELCGGTHVQRLGDIGLFRIKTQSGIATGVRRIEALTGEAAYKFDKKIEQDLSAIAKMLKTNNNQALDKVEQLIVSHKQLEKQLASLQKKLASNQGDELVNKVTEVGGIKLLASEIDNTNAKDLRAVVDKLKDKLGSAVIILAVVDNDKVSLVAGVTKDLITKYKAGDILNHVAKQIDGKGGGRADMAQGGGVYSAKLTTALASVSDLL